MRRSHFSAIGRNQAGEWIARDCDSGVSGAFFSKKAAIRFAKKINGPDCALMFLADGLELDGTLPRAARRPMVSRIAKAIAAIKLPSQRRRRSIENQKNVRRR
jgi:hypothetical protein